VTSAVRDQLLAELQVDIARILALPLSRIAINDIRVGSLIVTYTVQRNASQFLADDVINLLIASADFDKTAELYFNFTAASPVVDPVTVINTATIARSGADGTSDSSCSGACIIGIAAASGGGGLLVVIVVVLLIRRRRLRAAEDAANGGHVKKAKKNRKNVNPREGVDGDVVENPIRHDPFVLPSTTTDHHLPLEKNNEGVGKWGSDYDDDDAAAYIIDVDEEHEERSPGGIDIFGDAAGGKPSMPRSDYEPSQAAVEHVIVDIDDGEGDEGEVASSSYSVTKRTPRTRAPGYYPFVPDDDDDVRNSSSHSPFGQYPRKPSQRSTAISDDDQSPVGMKASRQSPSASVTSASLVFDKPPILVDRRAMVPPLRMPGNPGRYAPPPAAAFESDGSFLVRTAGDVDTPRPRSRPAANDGGEDTSRTNRSVTAPPQYAAPMGSLASASQHRPPTPRRHSVFDENLEEVDDTGEEDYEWVYEECPAEEFGGTALQNQPLTMNLTSAARGPPPTADRNPLRFWCWFDPIRGSLNSPAIIYLWFRFFHRHTFVGSLPFSSPWNVAFTFSFNPPAPPCETTSWCRYERWMRFLCLMAIPGLVLLCIDTHVYVPFHPHVECQYVKWVASLSERWLAHFSYDVDLCVMAPRFPSNPEHPFFFFLLFVLFVCLFLFFFFAKAGECFSNANNDAHVVFPFFMLLSIFDSYVSFLQRSARRQWWWPSSQQCRGHQRARACRRLQRWNGCSNPFVVPCQCELSDLFASPFLSRKRNLADVVVCGKFY
jgi:hypothetical protein